jgi:hypothetical protein
MCIWYDGQHWGIVQMTMLKRLGIVWIIALVNSLVTLHNFCIGKYDSGCKLRLLQQSSPDTHYEQ